ncbi:hypothetical protein V1478_002992 [Vespula squamosa]|uniref:Uncharacterized protein n=1 Tax=Vespula squamosa TaxID=30214 RepID=A0ABD2BRE8_VESSQ
MQKGEQRLFSGGNIICNVTPLDTKDDTLASFLEKEGKVGRKEEWQILASCEMNEETSFTVDNDPVAVFVKDYDPELFARIPKLYINSKFK